MIKLQAIAKPLQLTDEKVKQLTAEYKQSEKAVWKKTYITHTLLLMSFDKCCFCETKLSEESKYLEVEHFHPKSLYPDEVVSWTNLLPICKRCNGKKSNHDTKLEPIIHPVKDNPKEHLTLKNYRLLGTTELGRLTKDVVYLNDTERLVVPRFKVGNKLENELEKLLDTTQSTTNKNSRIHVNKMTGHLENIMKMATKDSKYSATAATILLNDTNFKEIKQYFIVNNLWSDDFKQLETQVEYCALLP